MLCERERYYGLGMDPLVTVCSGNMNATVVCFLPRSTSEEVGQVCIFGAFTPKPTDKKP